MDVNKRLKSLDALRGFDMMFIMGFAAIITAICNLFPNGDNCWLATQMTHVDWNGIRHHDTIFPLFLFLAGLSFPFSYAKSVSNGKTRAQIYSKIIYRGLMLVFLGLVYNGLFKLHFPMRVPSVLGRIGLAWMFAALLFINFKPKARAAISVVLLVGYYLLMKFVPAPDVPGAQPFTFEGNLIGYVDRMIMPGKLYEDTFDPEGLLGVIPAIVTAMFGMFTGELVRKPESECSGGSKTLRLLIAGVVMLVIGLVWSLDFPINKKLWSSTFVLVVGSYSVIMFAIFYWIIDVKGWDKWIPFFTVVGMNSITIYMAQRIINFRGISNFFLGGLAELSPEPLANLINAVGYFAVSWLFLYFLKKKNVFLKV